MRIIGSSKGLEGQNARFVAGACILGRRTPGFAPTLEAPKYAPEGKNDAVFEG